MDDFPSEAAGFPRDGSEPLSGLPSYKELNQTVARIETVIGKYDPLDLIASLAFENLAFSTASGPPEEGGQAFVEYIALLSLKEGQLKGSERTIPPSTISELQQKIVQLFGAVALRRGLSHKSSSPLDRARRHADLMFLSVRNLDDFEHLEALLCSLFDDGTAPVQLFDSHLGFRCSAATKLARSVGDLMNQKLATRKTSAQEMLRTIRAADNADIPKDLKPFLDETTTPERRDELIVAYVAHHTFSALSDVYSIQPAELVKALSADEAEVRRLLDALSMSFGDVSADFSLPISSHEFLYRPLIKSERGYFCPIPDLLLWAVRPRLEELLKTQASLWDTYQKTRARFVENRGAQLFGKLLPTATVLKELKYWSDQFSENHTIQQYELDLAVLFNGIAILVECKGGTLPIKARSGKSRPARDAVEDLILEPSSQADRARQYVESTANATFELPSGLSVVIDREGIDRVLIVALTLEDMNLFAADPSNLALVQGHADEELLWVVNVLTLELISNFLQFPAEFIHYLTRRVRLNVIQKVSAVEELDYFGCYLDRGLYFENAFGDVAQVALDGFTEPIEAYRRFETGRSTVVVEKPRQNFPPEMFAVLNDLQRINSRCSMQLSLLLLDMGDTARCRVGETMSQLREKSLEDGETHDFSTVSNDGATGFTFMVAKQLGLDQLTDRLSAWCEFKMQNSDAKRWGGIASMTGSTHIADGCSFLER